MSENIDARMLVGRAIDALKYMQDDRGGGDDQESGIVCEPARKHSVPKREHGRENSKELKYTALKRSCR